jgi:hypothetical protein
VAVNANGTHILAGVTDAITRTTDLYGMRS